MMMMMMMIMMMLIARQFILRVVIRQLSILIAFDSMKSTVSVSQVSNHTYPNHNYDHTSILSIKLHMGESSLASSQTCPQALLTCCCKLQL